MSHIMNHREIEYYTKQYWKANSIELNSYSQLLQESDKAMTTMKWLEDTFAEVAQEDLIMDYGIDCLRCYLLFEKLPKADDPYFDSWDEGALEGIYKFVSKYRRMVQMALEANVQGKYVEDDIEDSLSYIDHMKADIIVYLEKENTLANRHCVISILMEGFKQIQKKLRINEFSVKEHEHEIETAIPLSEKEKDNSNLMCDDMDKVNNEIYELCRKVVILAAPFAPYISEELWQQITLYEQQKIENLKKWYQQNLSDSVLSQKWDIEEIKSKSFDKEIDIPVQINSKTKKNLHVTKDLNKEELIKLAQKELSIALDGIDKYRVIYIEGKLINFVVNK